MHNNKSGRIAFTQISIIILFIILYQPIFVKNYPEEEKNKEGLELFIGAIEEEIKTQIVLSTCLEEGIYTVEKKVLLRYLNEKFKKNFEEYIKKAHPKKYEKYFANFSSYSLSIEEKERKLFALGFVDLNIKLDNIIMNKRIEIKKEVDINDPIIKLMCYYAKVRNKKYSFANISTQKNEWVSNPNFTLSKGGWGYCTYEWNSATGDSWVNKNTPENYAIWNSNGKVELSAKDRSWWNLNHNAATVSYWSAPLNVSNTSAITLKGKVKYGSEASYGFAWTGIKFDVSITDSSKNRPLYIEIYFLRTGINEFWESQPIVDLVFLDFDFIFNTSRWEERPHDEIVRTLCKGKVDNYMIYIPAFTNYANIKNNFDGSETFLIDVKSVVMRAAKYFGGSLDSYFLNGIGVTMESGEILFGNAGRVWCEVNELSLSYE
ncbi:MAG: hypothetical protein AB1779_10345 [Candidatus Thermoplasmatota archaeon]